MCCGSESRHGSFCGCGCSVQSEYSPRFMTRDQRITRLEQYLSGLKNEAHAVEECIASMKKDK